MSDFDVINEKFNNNKFEHDEVNKRIDKLDEKVDKINNEINKRIDNAENNINSIDRNLSEKWIALETTFKLTMETINNNITKVDKKVDKIIEKDEKEVVVKDTKTFEWVKSVGLIVIGIVITYIAKKLGL